MVVIKSSHIPGLATVLALGVSSVASAAPLDQTNQDQLTASDAAQAQSSIFVTNVISDRFSPVSNALSLPGAPGNGQPQAQGIAGGDPDLLKGWSLWGSTSARHSENSFAPEQQKSNSWSLTAGADRPISDTTTLGVSVTLSRDNADTAFGTGTRDTNAIHVSTYANFKLNDWLAADVSLGYGYTDTKQMRTVFGAPVTGSYKGHSVFGAANLKASKWQGPWLISGVVGLSGSSTRRDGFVESNGTVNAAGRSDLLQARIGGTIGYYSAPMLPYLSAEYIYDLDFDRSLAPGATNDRDEFRVTLGTHIYGTGDNQNLSGGIAISHSFGRDNKDDTSVNLSLRIAF